MAMMRQQAMLFLSLSCVLAVMYLRTLYSEPKWSRQKFLAKWEEKAHQIGNTTITTTLAHVSSSDKNDMNSTSPKIGDAVDISAENKAEKGIQEKPLVETKQDNTIVNEKKDERKEKEDNKLTGNKSDRSGTKERGEKDVEGHDHPHARRSAQNSDDQIRSKDVEGRNSDPHPRKNDTAYVPKISYPVSEHADYCILYNLTVAEDLRNRSEPLDYDPITLAIHSTMNYVNHVVEQADTWDDFISYALLIRAGEDAAVNALARLWRCYKPVRAKVSLHLIWARPPLAERCAPYLSAEAHAYLENDADCHGFDPHKSSKDVISRSFYSDIPQLMYPINVMRNVARRGGSATRLQLVADSENMFSAGFARVVRPLTRRYMFNATDDQPTGTLLAFRRFEVSDRKKMPRDVDQLAEMLSNKTAIPFHQKFFSAGHKIPNLSGWLKYSTNHSIEDIKADPLNYTNAHFEPQFIMPTDVPYHYEDVPTRFYDHQVLVNELCYAGYQFKIMSHVFNAHDGMKTKLSDAERLTNSMAGQRKRRFFGEFARYLRAKYGANVHKCPRLKS